MTELGRKLYIYGVGKNMGNGELFAEFEKFGRVRDVINTRKGFAFVTVESKDNAALAMRKMNGATMDRQTIIVNIGGYGVGLVGYGSLDRGGESESRRGSGDSLGCGEHGSHDDGGNGGHGDSNDIHGDGSDVERT